MRIFVAEAYSSFFPRLESTRFDLRASCLCEATRPRVCVQVVESVSVNYALWRSWLNLSVSFGLGLGFDLSSSLGTCVFHARRILFHSRAHLTSVLHLCSLDIDVSLVEGRAYVERHVFDVQTE